MKNIEDIHPFFFILVATVFEVMGDAIIRTSIYSHTGAYRIFLFITGTAFLFVYGSSLFMVERKLLYLRITNFIELRNTNC